MPRHAPRIAAFALASAALGSLLALTVPTELRTNPNSRLEQLSTPQIVDYSGADHVINGQDSYPVVYSPQYLAVTGAAERARLTQSEQCAAEDFGYNQPGGARDAALDRDGAGELRGALMGEVMVRRGPTGNADKAPPESPELAEDNPPEG